MQPSTGTLGKQGSPAEVRVQRSNSIAKKIVGCTEVFSMTETLELALSTPANLNMIQCYVLNFNALLIIIVAAIASSESVVSAKAVKVFHDL